MTDLQIDPEIARVIAANHAPAPPPVPAHLQLAFVEPAAAVEPAVVERPIDPTQMAIGPEAPPAALHAAASTAAQRLGIVITAIGVICCSFVAYQLAITDLASARSQELLRHQAQERFTVERAVAESSGSEGSAGDSLAAFGVGPEAEQDSSAAGGQATAEPVDEVERSIERPESGAAIALLRIPKAEVDQVIVEGTGHQQTATGPGHFRGSPLPGRAGNVIVIGRRTTHGAPFEHLGRLKRGDSIELTTGRGTFAYRVDGLQVIRPGQADVLSQDGSNRLTLVTADQPFDAEGRLVVTARPVGTNQPRPAPVTSQAALAVPSDELGMGADPSAWGAVLLWGQLLAVVLAGLRWFRSRWTPMSRWLVGAPVVLLCGVLFFEALGRLLPATV